MSSTRAVRRLVHGVGQADENGGGQAWIRKRRPRCALVEAGALPRSSWIAREQS